MVEGERPPLATQDRLSAPSDLERVDGMSTSPSKTRETGRSARRSIMRTHPPVMAWNSGPGEGEFEEAPFAPGVGRLSR